MEIRESDEQKYSKLNLYELSVLVKDFLIDYPFVRAVYLCRGRRGERRYNLLFEVPWVPIEMKMAYLQFKADVGDVPRFSLALEDAYWDSTESGKAGDEWICYEVEDAKDTENEGLHEFVVPGDSVLIYHRHIVKNNSGLFPELRFATLKSFAGEWAKKWPVIRRITLFRYSPCAPRQLRGVPVKYVLLFEIVGEDADLDSFEKATNYFRTIRDEYNDGILYEEFMPPVFENVYQRGAAEGYQKEWRLEPKREGKEGFHYESNPSWLIFDPDVKLDTEEAESAEPMIPTQAARPEQTESAKPFTYSPGFRCVNKDGIPFTLTPKQAQAIEILWNARENGAPDVGQDYIIGEVSPDTSTKRLRDIFKSSPKEWDALIEPGARKGTFRLKL